MANVVTLEDFQPVARYDGVPWTQARVEESAASTGPWTQIDLFVLDPVDADPTNPLVRDFTTVNATLTDGWYRVTFLDASGNTQVFEPVHKAISDLVPTAAKIREWSVVEFAEYKYPLPAAGEVDPLQKVVDESVAEFHGIFARHDVTIDLEQVDPETPLGQLINRAFRMLVEFNAAASQQENIDTAGDFDLLSSHTAGPATESRRPISANSHVLHVWPALHRVLAMIMKLWTSIVGEDLPPGVPDIHVPSVIPKPGEWVMDKNRNSPGVSPYDWGGPPPGVARVTYGGA